MQGSAVEQVISGLKAAGISVVCYLPDSLLKELYTQRSTTTRISAPSASPTKERARRSAAASGCQAKNLH
jgi:hypothetical protein